MKPFSFSNKWGKRFLSVLQHYNHEKYWRRRSIVINPDDNTPPPFLVENLFLILYKKNRCLASLFFRYKFECRYNIQNSSYFASWP